MGRAPRSATDVQRRRGKDGSQEQDDAVSDVSEEDKGLCNMKADSAPCSDQCWRIFEVLGNPTKERWPGIEHMPDYKHLWPQLRVENFTNNLFNWYSTRARGPSGFELFDSLLQYDPAKRVSAKEALDHPWFQTEPMPTANAFASLPNGDTIYPTRKLIKDESDPKMMPAIPSTMAQVAGGGGTSNVIPGAAGMAMLGSAVKNASLPMDPSAPAPSGSVGSVGSVEHIPVSAAQSAASSSQLPASQQKGSLVATATANAGRAAKRQKKA
jgi:serine/threonine protein kinase